jgi:hypothetical protein
MKISVYLLACVMLLVVSCKQGVKKTDDFDLDSIDLSDRENILSELDTLGAGIPIFYNMYLSVELSSLFETAGAVLPRNY